MKIKIIYPNSKGKIELTKEELERLLNESYNEGYSDAKYYSSPYITYGSVTGLSSNASDLDLCSVKVATSEPSWSSCHTDTSITNATANITVSKLADIEVIKSNEI